MQLFISHASEDKASPVFQRALRRLHDRYCRTDDPERSVTLWIDKPDQMPGHNFQCLGRIQYGRDYRDEIESALARDDGCVLFFLSTSALRKVAASRNQRGDLRWELEQGLKKPARFLAVMIDQADPQLLPAEFRYVQFCNLNDLDKWESHPAFDQLIKQIDEIAYVVRTPKSAGFALADFRAKSRVKEIDEKVIFQADRMI